MSQVFNLALNVYRTFEEFAIELMAAEYSPIAISLRKVCNYCIAAPLSAEKSSTINKFLDFYLDGKDVPFTEFKKPKKKRKKSN